MWKYWLLTFIVVVLLTAACSSSPSTPPATVSRPSVVGTSIPAPTGPIQSTASSPSSPKPTAVISTLPVPPPTLSTPAVMSMTPIPTSTTTPSTAPPVSATPGAPVVTISLAALNLGFDKNTISIPAGANVTLNFNNKDSGIPHNVAVYQKMADGQVKPIFIGDTINGPSTIVYHFVAPAVQGSYLFQCDVHPQLMVGTFVITP